MSATPQATRQYFDRLKNKGIKPATSVLGDTELTVSRIGFGCYRVHQFEPDHREALKEALLGGVNLIDTSANYTDGSSERLVGDILNEVITSGEVSRDAIVVVTKAGYVQGTNLRDARERMNTGRAYSEMVEFQSDCWHNISPEYLADQITKSLERLRLDRIDVLLLHNPEYFFKTGGSRDVYYARIEKAFRHLESEVAKGRIAYYGISSNTFGEVESRSDFTSLAKVVEIAKSISKNNHFKVVQLPFNLYEAGAALHKNNNRKSIFEFASESGLAVLTNRPFNALAKERLVRLTSFPTHDEVEVKGGLHTTLGRAIELEKRAPGYPKAAQGLHWAHALRERLGEIDDLLTWREVLYGQIMPTVRQALTRLTPDQAAWANEYSPVMSELFRLITWDLENLAEQKSKLAAENVQVVAPDLASSPTLSRKVLRVYHAFPEVTTVLAGMRTPTYVRDLLGTEAALTPESAMQTLMRLQRYRS
ncbi:MAG TPA: aldo/keto reductase [Bdellovibrionales bacterium]|nr:aldo/keto reductase [Bdellovibrionales bacterium]